MGQYHKLVNLDKREYLDPHYLGDGLKLWEQGVGSPGGVLTALAVLLAVSNGRGGGDFPTHVTEDAVSYGEYDPIKGLIYPGVPVEFIGRWGGDRIAFIGDYAEETDIPGLKEKIGLSAVEVYNRCQDPHDLDPDDPDEPSRAELFRNVSPIIAPYLEKMLGFTFVGDGWRQRHGDEGIDTCYHSSPLHKS